MDNSKNVKYIKLLEYGTKLILALVVFGGIIGAIVNITFALK